MYLVISATIETLTKKKCNDHIPILIMTIKINIYLKSVEYTPGSKGRAKRTDSRVVCTAKHII